MADLSARTPARVLSADVVDQTLADHRLYLETEYHQGHRANFSSAEPFSHHVLFNAFKRFSKSYSRPERAALFHDTAVRTYRISDIG